MKLPDRALIRPFPCGKELARTAVADYQDGMFRFVHMDQLSDEVLKVFWKLSDHKKREFVKEKFNKHHREPRSRDGLNIPSNTPIVLEEAHKVYNKIVRYTCYKFRIKNEESVTPEHICEMLNDLVMIFNNFFGVVNMEAVAILVNKWFPEGAKLVIRGSPNTSGVRKFMVERKP